MDVQKATHRLPLSAWQSVLLRVTTFHETIDAELANKLYNVIVGQEPETSVRHRGAFQAESPIAGKTKIALTVQSNALPRRIDWYSVAIDDGEPFGAADESTKTFVTMMDRWMQSEYLPPVKRLALGHIVLYPVSSREEGYRQLSAYLHGIELDPIDSSDFLYQINRPRQSVTLLDQLKINRLSKWSVRLSQRAQFGISGGQPQILIGESDTNVACQVELDINTVAEFAGVLPSDKLPQLLKELVSLSQEILIEGDIR